MNENELKSEELLQKGWIKVWAIFEVQASDKDVAEIAITKHINKVKSEKSIKILDEKSTASSEIEAPLQFQQQGVKKLWSKYYELILFAKDLESLMNMVINYAPSAIEIMGPEKLTLSMGDIQGALASVSDMMHKYAAAGIGGMLISGK